MLDVSSNKEMILNSSISVGTSAFLQILQTSTRALRLSDKTSLLHANTLQSHNNSRFTMKNVV
jgi:hypothetical protein